MQGRLPWDSGFCQASQLRLARAPTRLSGPGLLDRPIARGHRGALDAADPPRRRRRPNAVRGVPGEARDRLQRPHQPAQAAVRRGAARTRSGPRATRPAEVRAHRQGTRARARPDRAHEMGRPPLPDPGRPTPTHPPRRLRRQHRPRPPLRPLRQTRRRAGRSSSRPARGRHTASTPDDKHRPWTGPATSGLHRGKEAYAQRFQVQTKHLAPRESGSRTTSSLRT